MLHLAMSGLIDYVLFDSVITFGTAGKCNTKVNAMYHGRQRYKSLHAHPSCGTSCTNRKTYSK